MDISVVIPLYNEAEGLDELVHRCSAVMTTLGLDYELIFVEDGSTDNTLAELLNYRKDNSSIKILQLSRNFGHQAALTAGLEKSIGAYVAFLDGDLQDPPEVLADMYNKIIAEQADVIYGKRIQQPGLTHRGLLTRLFHKIFKRLSGFPELDNVGHFSLMNRRAANAILSYKESIRYLPGIRRTIGFKQDYILYERSARFSGKSKMKLSQLATLSSDAIFSFSKLPIKICLYFGLVGVVVFFLAGLYTLVAKIAGFAVLGWSSTVLSIYFLGSIQLTFLGVLGEYVYRIYKESQGRPLFLIKEYYN